MQTNGNILLITVVTKKYFEFIHTTDGANGIAHSITQNLLVSVIQNKYTVHWELLSSRSSMEGVIMNAFIKGDGLSPLIGTSVRGSNSIPFRLCHCVLSGGWRSDHCNMGTYSDQNRKQKSLFTAIRIHFQAKEQAFGWTCSVLSTVVRDGTQFILP